MKKRILFVDDDPRVLRGLHRVMFEMDGEWDIEFVESGQKALETLTKAAVDVVVSDIRMPDMEGTELLNEVLNRHPLAVRIILSGSCDKGTVMKSVGSTHQFLSKPLDGEKLKETLSRAFALRDLLTDDKLKMVVSRLQSLPSLPSLYQQLMAELQSPDVTMQKLGEIISQDVGMTAKMLQLVNSSFFGMPVHVSDPIHAAKLLGPEILRALVLSVQIFSKFDRVNFGGLAIETFSNHSLAVGSLAKRIALNEKQDKNTTDNALIAGMLHDTGKLILAQNLPERYKKALALVEDEKLAIWEAEQEIIGATHAEVGAYLLGIWGLPESIVEACAFHHIPMKCIDRSFGPLTAIHVANALESELDNIKTEEAHSNIDSEYLDELGLTTKLPEWREIYREMKRKRGSQ